MSNIQIQNMMIIGHHRLTILKVSEVQIQISGFYFSLTLISRFNAQNERQKNKIQSFSYKIRTILSPKQTVSLYINCQYNPFPIDIIPFGNEQWDTKYTLFIISKSNHFPFSRSIVTQSTSIMGHKSYSSRRKIQNEPLSIDTSWNMITTHSV